jgi:hypothetical protein
MTEHILVENMEAGLAAVKRSKIWKRVLSRASNDFRGGAWVGLL